MDCHRKHAPTVQPTGRIAGILLAAALLLVPAIGHAQDAGGGLPDPEPGQSLSAGPPAAGGSSQDLAKQLSNPVASLISLPFQQNFEFGQAGKADAIKATLNIQPVVPVSLGANWNMIVRTIVPLIAQNNFGGPGTDAFGLGDITQSFFFSPRKVGGIIWGAGPVFVYPSATDTVLGNDKWDAGPTIVLLKQAGKSSFGFLGNHLWSVAGNDSRPDVSATFLQPFYSYTTATATTFGLNTETSYDWKHKTWVVPINLSVSQLTKMGKQPVQIGIGGRYYVERPDGGPDWGLRLTLTMLFPKH